MKLWPLLLLACLAACGDDSSGPSRAIDREFAFDDPVGDTALFAGSVDSFPALDVRRVSGAAGADSLIFTMEFVGAVARANNTTPTSLVATIAVDSDDDSTTGLPLDDDSAGGSFSFTGPFPARTGVGAEYFVFVDSISGSNAEVYSILTDESVAIFPMTYNESTVTMRIPVAALGIRAGERFRVVGVVGNTQRLTDIIPDEGSYEVGGSS
ncbi:MAG TPA: hypothetical protein VFK04_07325 [Gemmatimonadaceae bacterium]|nr:hypothetical protein [Gemmatimonadaceae bacterium]